MSDIVIDRTVFDEMQDSMGADFAAELLTTFLQEAPKMLAELAEAEAAGDSDGFRRAAHSLKTNANIFGAGPLAALAMDLELGGPRPGGVDALGAAYAEAEAALRDLADV